MKKNGKMENEKIIFICNSKMNITPKNFHSNQLWGQSTVETWSPIKGMKKNGKMENEKIIFVCN